MSNLYIVVPGADRDLQQRAVQALQEAGIPVYRAWITPGPVELTEAVEPAWAAPARRVGAPLDR